MKFTKLHFRFDSLDLSDSNNMANTAKSTGETAINSFNPQQTAGAQQTSLGSTGLGGLLGGETNNYISDYSKAVANNPTVQSLYNTGNEMFNVPALAKTANYLQNQTTNAVPDAYIGARGFDIDNTDIQNGIASKLGYLTPQMNAATNNLNTAQGLASNYVNAGMQQNMQNLLPVQAEAPLLQQEQGLQGAGWNQAMASEFQGLIDKMNAGVTLSQSEMQRANTLAQAEEAFQQQQTANKTAITTANIGNQFKTVPAGENLVNTFANTIMNPSMLSSRTGMATYG